MTKQEKIREVAEEVGGDVYESYSGRDMYGERCMGIVCKNAIECIEIAGKKGLRGAKKDNMGFNSIVYWPNIQTKVK